MSENQDKDSSYQKVTWAQAFRDIIVTAMSTGQFPVFAMFFVIVFILNKIPDKDVFTLAKTVLLHLKQGEGLAYGFLMFLSYYGFRYTKAIRASFQKENQKLKDENMKLLKALTNLSGQQENKP
jgi:hypothetical protein